MRLGRQTFQSMKRTLGTSYWNRWAGRRALELAKIIKVCGFIELCPIQKIASLLRWNSVLEVADKILVYFSKFFQLHFTKIASAEASVAFAEVQHVKRIKSLPHCLECDIWFFFFLSRNYNTNSNGNASRRSRIGCRWIEDVAWCKCIQARTSSHFHDESFPGIAVIKVLCRFIV